MTLWVRRKALASGCYSERSLVMPRLLLEGNILLNLNPEYNKALPLIKQVSGECLLFVYYITRAVLSRNF